MKSTLIPTEIYRRAELFMVIADIVRTANAESDGLESVKPLLFQVSGQPMSEARGGRSET